MTYIDGYLTPVRRDRKQAFHAFSRKVGSIYKEHGALRVVDCWQDAAEDLAHFHAEGARDALDAGPPPRDFGVAADAQAGEVVVFSWMEWPDKETRDSGLEKAMSDPRLQPQDGEEMLFEGRRVIASGFHMTLDM